MTRHAHIIETNGDRRIEPEAVAAEPDPENAAVSFSKFTPGSELLMPWNRS
jgi:hypothetical protein